MNVSTIAMYEFILVRRSAFIIHEGLAANFMSGKEPSNAER